MMLMQLWASGGVGNVHLLIFRSFIPMRRATVVPAFGTAWAN